MFWWAGQKCFPCPPYLPVIAGVSLRTRGVKTKTDQRFSKQLHTKYPAFKHVTGFGLAEKNLKPKHRRCSGGQDREMFSLPSLPARNRRSLSRTRGVKTKTDQRFSKELQTKYPAFKHATRKGGGMTWPYCSFDGD